MATFEKFIDSILRKILLVIMWGVALGGIYGILSFIDYILQDPIQIQTECRVTHKFITSNRYGGPSFYSIWDCGSCGNIKSKDQDLYLCDPEKIYTLKVYNYKWFNQYHIKERVT